MNQVFQAAESRIKSITEERDRAITAFEARIAESQSDTRKAEDAMAAAAEDENIKAYQQAKAARFDALATMELFEGKLAALRDKPLVECAKYEQTAAEIMAAIEAEDDAARKKVENLAQQMQKIGDDLEETINRVYN